MVVGNSQSGVKRKKRTKVSAALPGPSQSPPNEPPFPPAFPPPPHQIDEEQQECPHCFLTPCATSHNHYWLGEGQPESRENHGVRKIKYRSYWKFINNSGGWNDNRYLLKKVAAGGQVSDKRELMPSCVVSQLRAMYPNPSDMPYMGHMWI